MNHPEYNRNDGSALIVDAYTVDQLKEFNRRNDEAMGWSYKLSRIYTNPKRLPETVIGNPDDIWNRTQK